MVGLLYGRDARDAREVSDGGTGKGMPPSDQSRDRTAHLSAIEGVTCSKQWPETPERTHARGPILKTLHKGIASQICARYTGYEYINLLEKVLGAAQEDKGTRPKVRAWIAAANTRTADVELCTRSLVGCDLLQCASLMGWTPPYGSIEVHARHGTNTPTQTGWTKITRTGCYLLEILGNRCPSRTRSSTRVPIDNLQSSLRFDP